MGLPIRLVGEPGSGPLIAGSVGTSESYQPGLTEDRAGLRCPRVPCQCPTDESVGVSVTHPMLGFQVSDDRHVLPNAAIGDDLLPLRNRAAVLRLD